MSDTLNTVLVTMSSGSTHEWDNVMWSISSDDTLVIYGLVDSELGVGQRTYKVAQFAKGAWDLVEIVEED